MPVLFAARKIGMTLGHSIPGIIRFIVSLESRILYGIFLSQLGA